MVRGSTPDKYAKNHSKIFYFTTVAPSYPPFIVIWDNSVFPFSCHLFWVLWTFGKRPDYLRPSQANDTRKKKAAQRSNLLILSRTFRNRIPDFGGVRKSNCNQSFKISFTMQKNNWKFVSYLTFEVPVKIRLWFTFWRVFQSSIIFFMFFNVFRINKTKVKFSNVSSFSTFLSFGPFPAFNFQATTCLLFLKNEKELAVRKWYEKEN